MFGFFKKNNKLSAEIVSMLPISTDIHSHILPGIDDGAQDIEASMVLITGLQKLGIKKMVATPHIIGDMFRNNAETISNALNIVNTTCKQRGIDIEITAAAEYMLDDYFMDLLKHNVPLLTIHDNLVLTEQSYNMPTRNINEICFSIHTEGYKPILAHPERYGYYYGQYEAYDELKNLGFLFQVNLLSLTGYYGKGAKQAAKYLFEKGMVDYVGTDIHHPKHLEAFGVPENLQAIARATAGKTYNTLG